MALIQKGVNLSGKTLYINISKGTSFKTSPYTAVSDGRQYTTVVRVNSNTAIREAYYPAQDQSYCYLSYMDGGERKVHVFYNYYGKRKIAYTDESTVTVPENFGTITAINENSIAYSLITLADEAPTAIPINEKAKTLHASDAFDTISKVLVYTDENNAYEYGNETGRTLIYDCPVANRNSAYVLSTKLHFRTPYRPYEAEGTLLNPAAEIGDAASFTNVYSGIYNRKVNFGALMAADISAPTDEEINNEFKFVTPLERKFERKTDKLQAGIQVNENGILQWASRTSDVENNVAALEIRADGIESRVSKTEVDVADNSSTIKQTSDKLEAEVKRLDKNGASLSSAIQVQAGRITQAITDNRNADATLSNKITATANSLAVEIKERKGDIDAAKTLISANTNAITTEVTRATSAENSLSSSIKQEANRITAEITSRQDAITAARALIDANAESIRAEVTRATSEEGRLSSSITQQANSISAKVSQTGGNNSTFGWSLLASEFALHANGRKVFSVDRNGAVVEGTIKATSGEIGGFAIGRSALQYNNLNWGDTDKNYGVYVGQSGIQLGKNFSVNNSGNVTANNMTLKGTLYFQNSDGTSAGSISAADLKTGAEQAYINHNIWDGTTSTVGDYQNLWTSGGYGGIGFNNATKQGTSAYPTYFTCGNLLVQYRTNLANSVYIYGYPIELKSATIDRQRIQYVGWRG